MNKKKQAYKNILAAIEKNKEHITDEYYINSVIDGLQKRCDLQDICDLFGIHDLPECSGGYYIKIDGDRHIIFCKKDSKAISWSDDGRQPDNEYLYSISFPTGAYIFGDFYPKELFQKFFLELKTYNPKYIDTANKSLYFSPDNAKKIHAKYKDLLKKYRDMAGDEYKKIRAEKLREELDKLEKAV